MGETEKYSVIHRRKKTAGIIKGLIILYISGITAPLTAQDFEGGSGTVGDPYQISTLEQLQEVKDYLSAHYILLNDIDASATSSWNENLGFEPIGNTANNFIGSLNGRGYTISGLTINRMGSEVGLFGYIRSDGVVENITLENVDITGNYNVGGLAGYNAGTVRNSSSSGDINASTYNAGGLTGSNVGTITHSYSTGSVSSSSYNIGGLTGLNLGTITYSYSSSSVNTAMHNVGGLAGINESIITNSYAVGSVTGGSNVGGLTGHNLGTVTNSFWDTQTSGQASSSAGTGKTTAEMKMHITFTDVGWDFAETWAMDEGDTYPFFQEDGYSQLVISGTEGWRIMSSPSGTVSFATLLDTLWTQGIPGADYTGGSPNILLWDEASRAWTAPSNTSDIPGQGTGFLVYVYSDDNSDGVAESFPKIIRNTEDQHTGLTTPSLSFTNTGTIAEDGWNLVGNPYGVSINWDTETGWSKTNLDNTFYVWSDSANGGTGSYLSWNGESGTLTDGKIAPWQGFWIKANNSSPVLSFSDTLRSRGGVFRKKAPVPQFRFTLTGNDLSNRTVLMFDERASVKYDSYDAYKLPSLKPEFLSLGTSLSGITMDMQALPLQLENPVTLALDIDGNDLNGTFSLRWDYQAIPRGWSARLIDSETGTITDLFTRKEYTFTLHQPAGKQVPSTPLSLLNKPKLKKADPNPRFTLVLEMAPVVSTEHPAELPSTIALNQNYPNPFNPSTMIRYQLPVNSEVQLRVYDLLGREVATLVNERKEAGYHVVTFNALNLASGVYMYRLNVRSSFGQGGPAGNTVITKKLTLIK